MTDAPKHLARRSVSGLWAVVLLAPMLLIAVALMWRPDRPRLEEATVEDPTPEVVDVMSLLPMQEWKLHIPPPEWNASNR